ncbi:MAG: hypothetical protein PHV06_06325 [bacterium]|nr:hypothetical protein [bacterium]
MKIKFYFFECPKCRTKFRTSTLHNNSILKCPKCKSEFIYRKSNIIDFIEEEIPIADYTDKIKEIYLKYLCSFDWHNNNDLILAGIIDELELFKNQIMFDDYKFNLLLNSSEVMTSIIQKSRFNVLKNNDPQLTDIEIYYKLLFERTIEKEDKIYLKKFDEIKDNLCCIDDFINYIISMDYKSGPLNNHTFIQKINNILSKVHIVVNQNIRYLSKKIPIECMKKECNMTLLIPRIKKTIKVTCKSCGISFQFPFNIEDNHRLHGYNWDEYDKNYLKYSNIFDGFQATDEQFIELYDFLMKKNDNESKEILKNIIEYYHIKKFKFLTNLFYLNQESINKINGFYDAEIPPTKSINEICKYDLNQYPMWFICGFPDIMFWLLIDEKRNIKETLSMLKIINKNDKIYNKNNIIKSKYLKNVIEYYKNNINSKFECC